MTNPVNPLSDTGQPVAPTSPRAFAQGTGLLLQIVGCVMFLSAGCVCLTSGVWDPVWSRGQVLDQLQQGQPIGYSLTDLVREPAGLGAMLTVMFSTVGGVAMAGFGLGLQSDQPRAAWGATATTLLLLTILMLAGGCLWMGGGGWLMQLWNGILALIVGLLAGFCVIALKQVRCHPPPPDLGVLPPDFEVPTSWRGYQNQQKQRDQDVV